MNLYNKTEHLLEEHRTSFLQTLINFNYQMMISALGALLYFLDTYVSKIMLKIPSHHILSVKILRLIFLSHPIKDITTLRHRHEVIEFFLKNENQIILKNFRDCLKNICNISNIILRILGTQATPIQWKTFYKTVHNTVIIGEICRAQKEKVFFFKEVSECLDDSLYIITHVIENIMDFEASTEQGRFIVKEGAVTELDEIREKYKSLPQIMETVAEMELLHLPDEIKSCSLIYLPEIGYLLGIPKWKPNLKEEDLILPNMEFKFLLNNVVHYKTARCEEMDEVIGDSHLIVLKHETEIMYQIVDYIRDHVTSITTMLDKIKMLDCLLAFSDVAREFDLVKPNLVMKQQISIKQGRHILQQHCVDSFIANDYDSSSEDGFIKIFTGPNSSGKSVYLKQVALIVYLAHIGSFVPAEKAIIGIVDYIHTRIKTTESVSTELSSFTLDLRQMYSCLYNSTPNTLIVIDEFGKGTADVDGLSLLYACIRHFIDRNICCPHLLISTHFHSLIAALPPSSLLRSQMLDFVINKEEITYLYKVKDGSVSSSFAHLAALSVGLPKNIVDRAKQVLDAMQHDNEKISVQVGNYRTVLNYRRKACLQKIITNKKEIIDDLQEIITLLNNVRF